MVYSKSRQNILRCVAAIKKEVKMKGIRKLSVLLLIVAIVSSGSIKDVKAYNGSEAAAYAEKYAENENKEYPYFDMDCTNFVSQCVNAGGKKMVTPNRISFFDLGRAYETKEHWFCKVYQRSIFSTGSLSMTRKDYVFSTTWTVVSKKAENNYFGFYEYMKANGAVCNEYNIRTNEEINTLTRYCREGDIIQARVNSSTRRFHSMVVTDKCYNWANKRYEIKVAYHSEDMPPTDFRTYFGGNSELSKYLYTVISPR